jgi:GTP cyclohydrolase I
MEATDAKDVAVVMEAKHLCMMVRGVEKQDSAVVTSVMLGSFKTDHAICSKFLSFIR